MLILINNTASEGLEPIAYYCECYSVKHVHGHVGMIIDCVAKHQNWFKHILLVSTKGLGVAKLTSSPPVVPQSDPPRLFQNSPMMFKVHLVPVTFNLMFVSQVLSLFKAIFH